MLTRINPTQDCSGACVEIKDASYPTVFSSGLEYASPARGTWNIVHTGMLVPQAHEIYVCAQACLRGVVLTAAEMNTSERFSTIAIRENNVLEGNIEDLVIDGVTEILHKLPQIPPAILLYTSCIQQFIGCDLRIVFQKLRERFSTVDFTDCYMNPIMRKNGLTPDQLMRKQLYSLLKPRKLKEKCINIIGNDISTDPDSELVQMILDAGFTLHEITTCKTYDEYQQMAESAANISYQPNAVSGGEVLFHRLGQKHLHLPLSYEYSEITQNLNVLAKYLNCNTYNTLAPDAIAKCDIALAQAKNVIGDTPIAIDSSATWRPISLALLLVTHGFHVKRVYLDAILAEEESAFRQLQKIAPNLQLISFSHVKMRILDRDTAQSYLAIGQKAAYFTGTKHFVNMIECGGLYGFYGICQIASLMTEAFLEEKETENLIQIKGLGCECCI